MKILLLCHDIPSISVGATLPIYHLIKQLHSKYDIHLVSFDSGNYDINEISGLSSYNLIENPEYESVQDQLLYSARNMISIDNLKTRSFLNYYYTSSMSKLVKDTLSSEDFDIVITDMPMAFYAKNSDIPSIVYAFDAVSDYNYNMYKKSSSVVSKSYWYLNYRKIRNYEKIYNNFDICIVVNQKDKDLLEKHVKCDIEVIANGVDIDYFKNNTDVFDLRLVFLGDMSTPPNNDAVRYFIDEIYTEVTNKNDLPFYIVGRNPTDYIKNLQEYDNITVTGSVKDVRKYLPYGSIFITPMISGTGIKNKILEAMSMNLAVITTSIGISGIDATDKKDFLLADDSKSFVNAIELLSEDRECYKKISDNAKKLVSESYSWEKSMKKMDDIIEKLVK